MSGSATDLDGDLIESLAWWDPATLPGNPVVRPELLASIDDVMSALGCTSADPAEGDEATCPCGTPVVYDEMNGWQHADGSISHDDGESVSGKMAAVSKGAVLPKGRTRVRKAAEAATWPGWALDLPAADYWGQQIATALTTSLTEAQAIQLANQWYAANPPQGQQKKKRDAVAAAALWLASNGPDLAALLAPLMPGIIADGWLIGAVSAQAMTSGSPAAVGTWAPGGTGAATQAVGNLGLGGQFEAAAGDAPQQAQQVADGYLASLGRALVDAVLGGQPMADAAKAMLTVLADAAQASAATLGQIVQAVGEAAGCWYRQEQVEYVEWLTDPGSNVCALCLGNEEDGVIPLGTPFSSGDSDAPAHPRCRCEVVPAGAGRTAPTVPLPQLPADAEAPTEPLPLPAGTEQAPQFEPIEFATTGDADKWLTGNRADWTPEQKQAVEWYAGSGSAMVNRRLREGADLPEDALGVNVRAEAAALDSAMSPLPADLVMERVVGADAFGGEDKIAGLTGKVITDQAYQSASLGGTSLGRQGVVMHIGAPEGTPAVVIGNRLVVGEREILLARGTRLAVSRAEEVDGRWHLWAMVIPG